MVSHKFIKFMPLFVILIIGILFFGGAPMGSAQEVTPTPPASGPPYYHGRVTPAERQAAAKRAEAAHEGMMSAQAAPAPGGTPDYFGSYPNYANSQLPELDTLGNVITGTGIRKFVDSLPGLGAANANNLGQYIPVGIPDTTTYPGSDYYEIQLVEYTEQMHSDLFPTKLRGYVQVNTTDATVSKPSYMGPVIVAQRDRPVRIKFTNMLPTGSGGDLFIPVDTTVMGAGTGPNMTTELYKENRATLHLHGGVTPWISDGTPHQWTTPANETTSYPEGVSVQNVPDMPDPGPGALTFFYTNQQSARLMFYHDHAYGITRLNVYAGEAAGYLVQDPVEQNLVSSGIIPADQIPLIIQDKTFVPKPAQLAVEDPTWDTAKYGGQGNLWFPHVYMTNQNPYDIQGVNAMGRWDYGPWFWPPYTGLANGPVTNTYYTPGGTEPPMVPGTPNPSLVPEAFMDTPVINGTAYPYLTVQPKAYRFRILNASNDRMWNLQLYVAKSSNPMWNLTSGALLDANAGEVPMIPAIPRPITSIITSTYTTTLTSTTVFTWPATWPTDGRDGGVPDPLAAGPQFIQIGSEGGFLPAPVALANTPVGYEYNRRNIVVLNVTNKTLFLGPAERADVIVDFSQYAGKTIIMYNDAPAPVPAFDPRYDYYTGDPDQTASGGAPTTLPGYGPNTRTIMQIQVAPALAVAGTAPQTDETALPNKIYLPFVNSGGDASGGAAAVAAPFDLAALNAAFASTITSTGAFAASQDPIIVPQAAYNSAYNASFPADAFVRIQDTSITFTPLNTTTQLTLDLGPKAIQELFEVNYGRMNATLGVELPNTNITKQTTLPFGYIDPATEIITDSITPSGVMPGDGTQIWKITHNGVDTHAIHVHLFNVQVINRVGWDGMVKPPDPNELGWKETIRMNPLEDAIVALRPVAPKVPFGLPNSVRRLDVTSPATSTMGFLGIDPLTGNPITVRNRPFNFGWEYVWHCHLLGHEENDMMRPMVFRVQTVKPDRPVLTATNVGLQVTLQWTDGTPPPANLGNPANEIGFQVTGFRGGTQVLNVNVPANQTSYTTVLTTRPGPYRFRVYAYNVAGSSPSNNASLTIR